MVDFSEQAIKQHEPKSSSVNWDNLLREVEASRVKEPLNQFFPNIDQYWEENADASKDLNSFPPIFHGTRMSALTGIRLDGLIPMKEVGGSAPAIFGTIILMLQFWLQVL